MMSQKSILALSRMIGNRRNLFRLALAICLLSASIYATHAVYSRPLVSSLSISDSSVTEGDGAGTVNMDFTVTLSPANPTQTVTVDFATGDFFSPIATAGVDYVAQSGTLTFNPGDTTKTISIVVNKDCVSEPSENLAVFLSNPINATLSNTRANGQITTDDGRSIIISDTTMTEGDGAGTVNMDFTVTLSGSPVTASSVAACGAVTVDFATGDFFSPIATAGVDYVAQSGTVTFNAGETIKTISIVVNKDCVPEPSENLAVFLSNPVGATLSNTRANGQITTDDGRSIIISDTTVTEGDGAGTVNMDFTVTLSGSPVTAASVAACGAVTVDFATGDFFSPIATAGVDYVAQNGTVTFNAGETIKTISVVVNKDCVPEPSENLAVFLSNPVGATLSNTRANGQITTDDGRSIIISDTTMTEGDGAGTVNMDFTVTLSGSPVTASSVAACGAVTVDFATGDFFSPIATAGVDYVAQSGTVTFNAGETIKTISIVVNKDCVPEPSENLAVFLSNPVGATLSNTRANGQITTDDQRSISISDPSVSEGAGVNANLDFTVTLTGSPVTTASVAACGPVTVDLATGDFFSPVATAGVDYVAKSATVTFNAGETTKTFSVVVLPDCITEPSEFLAVFASNPVNATLGTTRANGTIIDNATSCLTVTNTNDSGNGSLRQALANANVNSDGNVINFNFAGAGPFTITPATPLPTIVNPITIDGYTQPGSALNTNIAGSNAVLLIELDGSSPGAAGNGLNINASNCVVRGLVINRFTQSGINLNGSSNNLIEGNFIGTDTAGTANRGNGQYGIFNNGGSGNTIGGAGAASRNLVAFNGLAGIFIAGGLNNQIRGNNIFNNGGLGIDLAPNGVTPNDPGDPDTGANNLQNFPAITAIGRSGSGSASPDNSSGGNSSTTVHGTLNSTPNQSFTIDFYNNPACDALNNGEGKTYLGSAMTTTDGSGDASFTVVLPATVPGTVITATATDPTGNTSEFSSCNLPTAAPAGISGQVTNASGAPLGGVAITLTGNNQVRRAISDSQGFYAFREVAIDDFYTITPRLANYAFTPAERSFSLVGNKTDAAFTGTPDSLPNANPLDSEMFFVRQQYLDFLGREPEQGGLDYWTAELDQCRGDIACLNSRRVGVSAAFFMEREYQDTGSFVYRLYQASAARRPTFKQFITDSRQVIGGPGLEQSKTAFVQSWVQRPEFKAAYPDSMTNAEFVNKLCDTAGIAESSARDSYLEALNNGATRAVVLGQLIENAQFKAREYNPSFVLMQYFGYLKRDPEQSGYNFWLNVLNNQPNNYRGMVCSFITSAEYQLRFSSVVTHGNAECR